MTAERARGTSSLARIEAILSYPEIHALADAIPATDPTTGGRPRHYPAVAAVLFEALISVYGSARQVEAELSHPTVWNLIRHRLCAHGGVRVDSKPMRRHHYLYLRNTYLTDPVVSRPVASRSAARTSWPRWRTARPGRSPRGSSPYLDDIVDARPRGPRGASGRPTTRRPGLPS